MAANDYHFVTNWRFDATIEEVAAILEDVDQLSTWWASVYLDVKVTEPGNKDGVGKRVDLLTKGKLPYKLRWSFTVTESNSPDGFTIKAEGDFVGIGTWILKQDGPVADVTYDWRIRADKPLLSSLSWLLKPVFRGNHEWAMAQGETCLRQELLDRRRLKSA